jgi:hypothetical protein
MKYHLQDLCHKHLATAKNAYQILIIADKILQSKEKEWAEIKGFQPTES